ncbi:MAG: nucleoside-diphosphate kinase [Pelosinus sp.]|nr:nucleoside-diphosphate kinase [Pelosinus sp.]
MREVERTLVLLKPDAVERNLCGRLITRFEERGFMIIALKMLQLSAKQAEDHYAEHVGKSFFPRLVEFITSGPLVAMVLEGEQAVKAVRTMMGPTQPIEAMPGTIRGDFALNMGANIIHGSDSVESAKREIAAFFTESEIYRR